jgi:hypothetical protein
VEPDPVEQQLFASAGAEIFDPAPGERNLIKFCKKPLIFHIKLLNVGLKIKIS